METHEEFHLVTHPYLTAHAIVMSLAAFVFLPLGVRFALPKSAAHKPWQLLTVLLVTIAAGLAGGIPHHPDHAVAHPAHPVLGWTLLCLLWAQAVLGWS